MSRASPDTGDLENPLRVAGTWLARVAAGGLHRNPSAMALATVDERGRPAVRMVLLKALEAEPGYIVFYTNYRSRKGREIEQTPWGAAVMYFEELGRQVRLEGPVRRSPAAESDAYFASRPLASQINAWVSAQSEPLDDPGKLEERAANLARERGASDGIGSARGHRPDRPLERPPFWGGFRLWCEAVELWSEGKGRFHQRSRYERELRRDPVADFVGGPWRCRRLQP